MRLQNFAMVVPYSLIFPLSDVSEWFLSLNQIWYKSQMVSKLLSRSHHLSRDRGFEVWCVCVVSFSHLCGMVCWFDLIFCFTDCAGVPAVIQPCPCVFMYSMKLTALDMLI